MPIVGTDALAQRPDELDRGVDAPLVDRPVERGRQPGREPRDQQVRLERPEARPLDVVDERDPRVDRAWPASTPSASGSITRYDAKWRPVQRDPVAVQAAEELVARARPATCP